MRMLPALLPGSPPKSRAHREQPEGSAPDLGAYPYSPAPEVGTLTSDLCVRPQYPLCANISHLLCKGVSSGSSGDYGVGGWGFRRFYRALDGRVPGESKDSSGQPEEREPRKPSVQGPQSQSCAVSSPNLSFPGCIMLFCLILSVVPPTRDC